MVFGWPFKKKKSTLPPDVEAVFQRVSNFLNSDAEQLSRYPPEFRSLLQNAASVDRLPGSSGPFGQVLENPIPVNGPIGEIIYLSALRRNGARVLFHRLGSVDRLDIFECVSADGYDWDLLYFDMYHPRKSHLVPHGYTRAPNALLSGVNITTSEFPNDIYREVLKYSNGVFGFSLADPSIRLSLESCEFIRPPGHAARLAKLQFHGRVM